MPYEILTGHKPNVSYFKVFGCKCYILIKGTRLSKFESKAQEGIFVGYAAESHAYRIFNKTTSRVVETCDVEFLEDNGSREEQSVSSAAGDGIPSEAIGRMGIGFFQPIEGHLVADLEGPSSTHVEPSPRLDQTPAPEMPSNNQATSTSVPEPAAEEQEAETDAGADILGSSRP